MDIVLMTSGGDSGDNSLHRHIPGSPNSTFQTLCGWCDAPGQERHSISDKGPPDCPACIRALEAALKYKKYLPKKVKI